MSTPNFFKSLRQVRTAVGAMTDPSATLAEIESLLDDGDVRREFLNMLKSPVWLEPLNSRGWFQNPPPAQLQGDAFISPSWPQADYLRRMASEAPERISAILGGLSTDNRAIARDVLRAAKAMPARYAAALVPRIVTLIEGNILADVTKDVGELCAKLAADGEAASSVDLLRVFPYSAGTAGHRRRDDLWHVRTLLDEVIPALTKTRPHELIAHLALEVSRAIDGGRHGVDADNDHSYYWRPAIEENEQNSDYDYAGVMVGVMRAGLEESIRSGLSLSDALNMIGRYHYLVFKRLRIHLVNEFVDQDPGLARTIILNHDLFDDYKFRHEYGLLVGNRFDLMTRDEREQWFGWIDAGPDMTDFDKSIEENVGRAATEKDRQGRIDYWKFEKLHWVRKHLGGARKVFYERMMAENGEPKLAYFVVWSGPSRWGWESPKTVGELAGMTFADALAAVSSWTPKPGDTEGPNVQGLATTFEQFVGTNPAAFSVDARLLIGKPAHFVRPFIAKMGSAMSSEANVDVGALFDLCRWVIRQPSIKSTPSTEGADNVLSDDWQWTRSEIARLLRAFCSATTAHAPKYQLAEFREQVWSLISALCDDPAESAISFDFSREDPRVNDYLDLGINSARGKAIEAVLEYARWVGNQLKQTVNGKEIVPGGFNSMREVQDTLEAQITTENRRFEVLSIIGSRISLIYWIDKDWLAASARMIFRLENIEKNFALAQGWGAWNAFLVWEQPRVEFYELFKPQFAYAVTQASKVQPTERSRQQPMNHLGEHLVLLYGRGQLGFDDDDALLSRFLNTANPEIRRHAFRFIGLTLENSEHVPIEILNRFQSLWTTYWAGAGKADAKETPNESVFGDWFTSAKFPNQWALEQLESYQEVVTTPAPDYEIAERLANIASTDPARSARILDKMVRGDNEGWRIGGWLEPATKVLKVALAAGGEAETVALSTIDILGRRGYVAIGELLQGQN